MAVFAADNPTQPLFPELTERERDVLRLVAEGHNNPTIARTLYVSPKTIANHVSNILTKLHFADRAEASSRHDELDSPPTNPQEDDRFMIPALTTTAASLRNTLGTLHGAISTPDRRIYGAERW